MKIKQLPKGKRTRRLKKRGKEEQAHWLETKQEFSNRWAPDRILAPNSRNSTRNSSKMGRPETNSSKCAASRSKLPEFSPWPASELADHSKATEFQTGMDMRHPRRPKENPRQPQSPEFPKPKQRTRAPAAEARNSAQFDGIPSPDSPHTQRSTVASDRPHQPAPDHRTGLRGGTLRRDPAPNRQAGNRALDYSSSPSLARFPSLGSPSLAFASLLWLVPFYLFSLSPPPPPPVLPCCGCVVWFGQNPSKPTPLLKPPQPPARTSHLLLPVKPPCAHRLHPVAHTPTTASSTRHRPPVSPSPIQREAAPSHARERVWFLFPTGASGFRDPPPGATWRGSGPSVDQGRPPPLDPGRSLSLSWPRTRGVIPVNRWGFREEISGPFLE